MHQLTAAQHLRPQAPLQLSVTGGVLTAVHTSKIAMREIIVSMRLCCCAS
jgi:hypothetical protein